LLFEAVFRKKGKTRRKKKNEKKTNASYMERMPNACDRNAFGW